MSFIIFERFAIKGNPDEDAFVSLSCEQENEVQYCEPISLEITEAVDTMTPVIVVTFKDMNGDLFNHMKINTGAEWKLEYGRSLEESITMTIKPVKIEAINGVMGRPMEISFKVYFFLSNWYESLCQVHNRGWSEEKTISDVVSDLVSDLGFDNTEIHDTDNKGPFVQPFVTNVAMTKWCREQAIDSESESEYHFGVNTSNNFFFYNTDRLFDQERVNINSNRLPKFIMKSQPDKMSDIRKEKSDNDMIPSYFQGIEYKEDYASGLKLGASGIRASWYDWETGEHKIVKKSVDQLDAFSLSELTNVRDIHADNVFKFCGGRDNETDRKAASYLNEVTKSITKVNILTSGSILLSIFDVVELFIPNTVYDSSVPNNDILGGLYMVEKITHRFGFNDSLVSLNTSIKLQRHGVNSVNYSGFDDLLPTSKGTI